MSPYSRERVSVIAPRGPSLVVIPEKIPSCPTPISPTGELPGDNRDGALALLSSIRKFIISRFAKIGQRSVGKPG